MAFEDDVFVSYSHLDDQAFEGQPGWISELHRALAWRLPQLLGKKARIWRDPKLQGNDVFAATIVERLPHVAVLVSVVSPPYIRSEWCKRELEEFLRASNTTGGIRVADKMRVFKVVKMPVSMDEQPPELRSMLGYEFYTVDVETGRRRELGPMSPAEVRPLYWSRVDDLAQDITELLNTLERSNGGGQPLHSSTVHADATPEQANAKEAVYLAETTHDLRDRRDAIRRELQSRGYLVLPDQPLPLVAEECVSYVRAQLERARLSIHMIGGNYGIVPEGHLDSTVVLQHELALERSAAAPLHRLIWIPPDLTATDERQQKFVARLQNDPRVQAGADLLETPLEDFKTILQARLSAPDAAKAPRPSTGGARHVYVVCEQRDRETVRPLQDLLYTQGFEVIPSSFEGDEADIRRDHEENLVSCDAVLVYWGAGSEQWLRRKLREQQKSLGYGRTRPLLASGVFIAPPLNEDKRRFRSHEAIVVDWSATLTADLFEPFFCRLR